MAVPRAHAKKHRRLSRLAVPCGSWEPPNLASIASPDGCPSGSGWLMARVPSLGHHRTTERHTPQSASVSVAESSRTSSARVLKWYRIFIALSLFSNHRYKQV
jgi:hypothetical protein